MIFPAVAFATIFMVIPTIYTIILSFQDRRSEKFVGLANYQYFLTNPDTLGALKNSLLWLVFFTGGVVIGGLLIAVLFDRVRYEPLAKLAVFLPIPDQCGGRLDHLEVHVRLPAGRNATDRHAQRVGRDGGGRPDRLARRIGDE